MKVLITGGNGTISQAIKKILEYENYTVFDLPRTVLDVTNEQDIVDVFNNIKPDILINNAGYIQPNKIVDINKNEWEKHLSINLTGAFLCAKQTIINNPNAIIINIGSTSAFEGRDSWLSYCCSKTGMLTLTEALVEEGYVSYSLNPARTETKMRNNLFPTENKTTLMNPLRVGEFILRIIKGNFNNGSHIILTKDSYSIIFKRKCPK